MKAICVDDERILVKELAAMCLELPEIDEVKSFVRAREALEWLEHNPVDIALLDIDMPEINGIQLAAKIKTKWPDTAIVFVTSYAQYAVEAFKVRAVGYLMKPVTKETLAADVAYALSGKKEKLQGHIVVKTFGIFDIFVDDNPVKFKMAKCKEILAYLVDKQGNSVPRAEISSALWEDRMYDRKQQNGIEDMVEMQSGNLRVVPKKFVCDAYLFFQGDSDIINSFRGEYMTTYPWASITEGTMAWSDWDDEE